MICHCPMLSQRPAQLKTDSSDITCHATIPLPINPIWGISVKPTRP
jgi:hypothetical protein